LINLNVSQIIDLDLAYREISNALVQTGTSNKCLKSASVTFGFWTGSGRLTCNWTNNGEVPGVAERAELVLWYVYLEDRC